MLILYLLLSLALLIFIGFSHYIHAKRLGKELVESYRWYLKILK